MFLATLMESRMRFQAMDLLAAYEFILHILAAVTQKEVTAISSQTQDALATNKARGFAMGTPANLTNEAKFKGLVVRQANAQTNVNNQLPSCRSCCGPTGRFCGRLLSNSIRLATPSGGGKPFTAWGSSACSPSLSW